MQRYKFLAAYKNCLNNFQITGTANETDALASGPNEAPHSMVKKSEVKTIKFSPGQFFQMALAFEKSLHQTRPML
jgi:hypothetical protein